MISKRTFRTEEDGHAESFIDNLFTPFYRVSDKERLNRWLTENYFRDDVEFGFPISEPVIGLENAKKKLFGNFF